jgi:hypothetical protein
MVTSKMRIPNYKFGINCFPEPKRAQTDRDLVVHVDVLLGPSINPAFIGKIKDDLAS